MTTPLRVLAVASEVFPLIKTGGLADVAGALPLALAAENVATIILLPGYPAVLAALVEAEPVWQIPELLGGPVQLLQSQTAGLDLLVIDAPHLFDRPGNPYTGADGQDWPDNARRFAALARVAAWLGQGRLQNFEFDILHAHDWQAGLAMAYLHYDGVGRPGTVMTVHNLAFQGLFPASLLAELGLPDAAFGVDGVEFHGQIGFLKAGLAFADRVTTVSPTYATEILTPDAGMGLDGLLRSRETMLSGIVNGIDDIVWNPQTDRFIAPNFNRDDIAPRVLHKAAVQERFGLEQAPDKLLLGVISRLSWQKGLDLVLDCLDELRDLYIQLVVLGTGDSGLEAGFAAASKAGEGRIGCVIGYNEKLAHRMQAGVDALLVPSRFEPCGLTQLCAMRYGAVPIVARVGGLADTVIDADEPGGCGITFSTGDLRDALHRAAALWQRPHLWRHVQGNGMTKDVSWRGPAAQYAALYRGLVASRTLG